MTNEEKARKIAEYLNQPNGSNSLLECHQAAMAMAKWKDEQFAQEKQALIQKYEDKLNKLNQREEVFRDNVRRANSRYGFEGLF